MSMLLVIYTLTMVIDYANKYPYGKISNHRLSLKVTTKYLIVAGDISDDINISIDYLNIATL